MPRNYRRYEPDQSLLLPPSLRDWLPEDHLAFFLSDAIDAMELSAFEAAVVSRLNHKGQEIAYGEFHLKGGGGLALNKWRGTRSTMNPVIDELLAAYKISTLPKSGEDE